jgi:hypothetical protein
MLERCAQSAYCRGRNHLDRHADQGHTNPPANLTAKASGIPLGESVCALNSGPAVLINATVTFIALLDVCHWFVSGRNTPQK